jgi:hypothetical protein
MTGGPPSRPNAAPAVTSETPTCRTTYFAREYASRRSQLAFCTESSEYRAAPSGHGRSQRFGNGNSLGDQRYAMGFSRVSEHPPGRHRGQSTGGKRLIDDVQHMPLLRPVGRFDATADRQHGRDPLKARLHPATRQQSTLRGENRRCDMQTGETLRKFPSIEESLGGLCEPVGDAGCVIEFLLQQVRLTMAFRGHLVAGLVIPGQSSMFAPAPATTAAARPMVPRFAATLGILEGTQHRNL